MTDNATTEATRGNQRVQSQKWDGFIIESIRHVDATGGEFKPSKVLGDGNLYWWFFRDHSGYPGFAKLVEFGDELVIALVRRKNLEQVLPVRDLPNLKKVGNLVIGGRPLQELITLKEELAKVLGLTPVWTDRERQMRKAMQAAELEKKLAEHRAEREAMERAEEERRQARDKERTEILSRKRVYVVTAAGRRFGIPINGDEWMKLPDGTFCVDGKETFVVRKKGSVKKRDKVESVLEVATTTKASVSNSAIAARSHIIPINGVPQEVVGVPSMDAVRQLNERGLNSGTLVMCPHPKNPDRFSVYRLTGGEIAPVTEVTKRSAL